MKNVYNKECKFSENGAIFCLTARGRIVEGIDFSNEQARAVYLIGVPNPDREAAKV